MKYLDTNKKKFYFLLGGSFLFILISYKLAVSKTIDAFHQKKDLTEKILMADNAPQEIAGLKIRVEELNNILGAKSGHTNDFHIQILNVSSTYSQKNNIVIKNYPEEHVFQENDYILRTNILTVEGRFLGLLRFLYFMERQNEIGKIVSSNFYMEKEKYSRKKNLFLKLYIQNITSKQYEN
jgi:hypothetical protein